MLEVLHRARGLPQPRYDDESWLVLDALVTVLKRAAVELETLFARRGRTDYAGLAAAALRGLGDEDGVTDLGLYLDRRIRHVLVDEFQDTNFSQLHLLEKLTAGWEPGDGRSLFLVGDPMQSIYRFREAEVGLFMRARDQGIGPLSLESKRLASNFRSRDEIVGWVNDHLGPIFPEVEDAAAGAPWRTRLPMRRGVGVAAWRSLRAPIARRKPRPWPIWLLRHSKTIATMRNSGRPSSSGLAAIWQKFSRRSCAAACPTGQ